MQVCEHVSFHLIWLSIKSTIPGWRGKVSLCCKTLSVVYPKTLAFGIPPMNGESSVVPRHPSIQCSSLLDFILKGVQWSSCMLTCNPLMDDSEHFILGCYLAA